MESKLVGHIRSLLPQAACNYRESESQNLDSEGTSPCLNWYALKVRTRAEQLVGGVLECKGYELFVPTYLERRQYSDRVKKIQSALFPGYVFCRLNPTRPLSVVTTAGVEHIVGIGGTPCAIEESEINAIRRVVEARISARPWPYVKCGERVRIQFGALAGIEGVVCQCRGTDRLVLSVHILQRSVSVEIDRTWVNPVIPNHRCLPGDLAHNCVGAGGRV